MVLEILVNILYLCKRHFTCYWFGSISHKSFSILLVVKYIMCLTNAFWLWKNLLFKIQLALHFSSFYFSRWCTPSFHTFWRFFHNFKWTCHGFFLYYSHKNLYKTELESIGNKETWKGTQQDLPRSLRIVKNKPTNLIIGDESKRIKTRPQAQSECNYITM